MSRNLPAFFRDIPPEAGEPQDSCAFGAFTDSTVTSRFTMAGRAITLRPSRKPALN